MKTVMLCGAGGTGKTSVLDAVCERLNTNPLQRMGSVTRKVYSKLEINSEKVALDNLTESEMKVFQTTILDTFIEEVMQKVMECKKLGLPYILLERSPYDYVAYQINVLPSLPLNEINDLIARVDQFMDDLAAETELILQYLPYPTPWASKEGDSHDELRYAPAGKNYAWDSVLRRLIRLGEGTSILEQEPRHKFFYMVSSSIEDRALEILAKLYPQPDEPAGDPIVSEVHT